MGDFCVSRSPPIVENDILDLFDAGLLARYAAGEASDEERVYVERWLAADPERQRRLDVTVQGLVEGAYDLEPQNPVAERAADDAGWRTLIARAGLDAIDTPVLKAPVVRSTPARSWSMLPWAVAAAIVVTIAFWRFHPSASAGHAYATAAGQRETIRLMDGTELTLAPASRVQLSADYGHGSRQVFLQGEAYFHVRHDATHPFTVRAHGVTMRDVGTTFDARAYDEEQGIRLAVVEGAVAVDSAMAHAGDILVATPGRIMRSTDGSVTALTAWVQGDLVFDKTPLREVVRDISRLYGVSITVTDSTLLTQRITTALSGKSLDAALDIVTRVVGARFERTAHGVVIRSGAVKSPVTDSNAPRPLRTVQTGT